MSHQNLPLSLIWCVWEEMGSAGLGLGINARVPSKDGGRRLLCDRVVGLWTETIKCEVAFSIVTESSAMPMNHSIFTIH
jgi:hypothetical protein